MKTFKFNNNAFYYKCLFWLAIMMLPFWVVGLINHGEIASTLFVYVVIGIPLMLSIDLIIFRFLFGCRNKIEISENQVIIYKQNYFEKETDTFDINDISIENQYLPCLEHIYFHSTHPQILYKYMFSIKDYKNLITVLENNKGKNAYTSYNIKSLLWTFILILLILSINLLGIKMFF